MNGLQAIVAAILSALVLLLLWRWKWVESSTERAEALLSLRESMESITLLRKAITEQTEALGDATAASELLLEAGSSSPPVDPAVSQVPKLLEGLTAVTQAQVSALVDLQESVGKLHAMFFGQSDASGYRAYSESEAGEEYETQELIRRAGITRSEAEARIKEKNLYSNFRIGG